MLSVLSVHSCRFLSSTSASGLLRRSRASSCCVSSPMAKYASCWRAHGPQKATPRISTSARRGQGLCVLLRTWQGPGFVTSVKEPSVPQLLDRFFEDVARAEGGYLLGRDLHLLAGLGVPPLPGLALLDGELSEARDLDLLASLERFGHYLLEGLEVLLSLALGHPSFLCDPLDEFLLLHGRSFLWSSSASWRAYLGFLLPVIRDSESLAIPSVPADLAERILWGVWRGTYTTFRTSAPGAGVGSSRPICPSQGYLLNA